MTDKTKILLNRRFKVTKCFYKNGQRESDREKVLEKSAESTRQFLKLKKSIFLK